MVQERRSTVTEERVEPDEPVVVQESPGVRVVEEPSTTYVQHRDPVATSIAAGSLIQTVVWAVVVIVAVVVGILVLVHFKIL
ncbi:MAG TPA: hypothetical protein VG815_13410 [Chloroflexota bacterium]|jgi:hypothetical protein|nr:hypothetical protein [Chloroflexota bacterium]